MLHIYASKIDASGQHECATALLNHVFTQLGFSAPVSYERNEHGKPYLLPPNEKIYVNWSHSGDYILCALSDSEIGVDLERMKQIPEERLVRRVIRGEERAYYEGVPEEARIKLFYEYWTLKESFLKAIGTGFYTSLDAFRIIMDGTYPIIRQEVDDRKWQCRLLDFAEEDYAAAICCEELPDKPVINYL